MEAMHFTHNGLELKIDRDEPHMFINGESEPLTLAEWKLLLELINAQGQSLSREALLERCLGSVARGSLRTIDTHIKNLRKKLQVPGWIKTVRGEGYRFNPEILG